MVDHRENECGGQTLLTQSPQSIKKGAKPGLESLDDAIVPIVRMLRDQPPGVGGEEAIIIAEIKPLRVPLGMIGRQPSGDVLSRLFHVAHLLDQVEAAGSHRLPHPSSPTWSMEQLTPIEVEPQIPMWHHPQVALTHHGKDHHGGDSIRGEVLELDAVVVAKRPHEAAHRRSEPVAVEFGEGDDVALRRTWFPVLRQQRDPLGPRRGRGHRSPSFSKSCNRRSVMIDERQSSAATSLTGIVLSGEMRLNKSLLSRTRSPQVRRKEQGEQEQGQWQNAEGTIAGRSTDIYKHPERADPTITVTSSMNVPPNGLVFLTQGVTNSANGTMPPRLSPKKARPMGRKTNRRGPSFCRKVSLAPTATGTSRERRLARRPGLTVALEYSSQGYPVGGRNEACLDNSLGVSKARASRSRGIPTRGGVEALDSIERDRYP